VLRIVFQDFAVLASEQDVIEGEAVLHHFLQCVLRDADFFGSGLLTNALRDEFVVILVTAQVCCSRAWCRTPRPLCRFAEILAITPLAKRRPSAPTGSALLVPH
jgi:hypothetical protein